MLPAEIYHYIVSKMDGFERENMRLVCKMFNEFRFIISSKNPARDREVLLIDCNRRFYELFRYGHLDIIKQCYKRYSGPLKIFIEACRNGFAEFAIYIRDTYNITGVNILLSWVCIRGDINAIIIALENGANDYINGLNKLCKRGDLILFDYLLSRSGISPIMDDFIYRACESGNMKMLERVMGFPTMGKCLWDISLSYACKGGDMDIVEFVISMGTTNHNLGFSGACENGNMDIINLMIENGATYIKNIGGACWAGNIELVKLLMQMSHIDDVHIECGFNIAIACNHLELVKLLVRDSFVKESLGEITARTSVEIIEFLIEKGAVVDSGSLIPAILHENLNQIKCLLKNGAIVNNKTIEFAKRIGDKRIIKYLESQI